MAIEGVEKVEAKPQAHVLVEREALYDRNIFSFLYPQSRMFG